MSNRRDAEGLTAAERLVVEDRARLAAVHAALALNGALDSALRRLTSLVARTCAAPVAAVSFVDRDRQVFKSAVGLPEPWRSAGAMPLRYSFCKHAVGSGMPLIVRDALRDPLLRGNASVRELGVRAYAGVPIITPAGLVLGTLNVTDMQPREWNAEELDVLAELAAVATTEIEHQVAAAAAERCSAELTERLRREVRDRDESLAMTVHDLRNYLNVISLGIALLEENESLPACAQRRRDMERIQASARQMDQLIQDQLDVAKLRCGSFNLRPRVQRVDALVREPVALFRPGAQKREIALEVRLAAGDVDVVADQDAIVRVFSNLIGNAIKFTPAGGTITVGAEQDGGHVRFTVADTGPGIAEEELPLVFDRFWQSKGHAVRGAGLGLAIAKGIVEAHGGRIWVESRRGSGTTFCFTIPLASAVPEPAVA